MSTILTEPNMAFNPVSIEGMNISPISQIQLKTVNRYVTVDRSNKLIYFYLELADSDGHLILLPVKYYGYLASALTPTVICDYCKVYDNKISYNLVEIRDYKKAPLDIVESVKNPFVDGNIQIPEVYCKEYVEECLIRRLLNNTRPGMVYGMVTAYIKNNTSYIRGICSIEDLVNRQDLYNIAYRKLIVNNEEYICDFSAKRRV